MICASQTGQPGRVGLGWRSIVYPWGCQALGSSSGSALGRGEQISIGFGVNIGIKLGSAAAGGRLAL